MSVVHEIAQGDTLRTFTDKPKLDSGLFPLTGATLKFILENRADGSTVEGTGTIVNPTDPDTVEFRYSPAASDVATEGYYNVQFLLIKDGKELRIPPTYNQIRIVRKLTV